MEDSRGEVRSFRPLGQGGAGEQGKVASFRPLGAGEAPLVDGVGATRVGDGDGGAEVLGGRGARAVGKVVERRGETAGLQARGRKKSRAGARWIEFEEVEEGVREAGRARVRAVERWGLWPFCVVVVGGLVAGGLGLMMGREPVPLPVVPERQAGEALMRRVAGESLEAVLAAGSVDELLGLVLRRDEVEGRLRAYYGGRALPGAVWDRGEIEWFGRLAPEDYERGIGYFLGERGEDGGKVAFFFRMDGGRAKLDWETMAQTESGALQRFVAREVAGASGIFRVLLQRVRHPLSRGRYPDGAVDFVMIEVAGGTRQAAFAAELGSPLAQLVAERLVFGDEGASSATVELAWEEGAGGSELVLRRFFCWGLLGVGFEPLIDVEGEAVALEFY